MKISTARRCITPTGPYFPCYLCGHAIRVDKAVGVKDDLWCNVYHLNVEGKDMLWISLDICVYAKDNTDELKAFFAEEYNIDQDMIIISVVHTHAGPESDYESVLNGNGAVKGYPEFLKRMIKEAVADAMASEMLEAEVYMRKASIEGYYGNRNSLDGIADKSICLIEFYHDDILIAAVISMACHPTVLGPDNLYVSGDLAGYLCRGIQREFGVYPFFMQGAAGDTSNRLYRKGNDYDELRRVGDGILEQFFRIKDHEKLKIDKPVVRDYSFKATFSTPLDVKMKRVEEIEAKIANARNFDEKKVYTSSLAVAKRSLAIEKTDFDLECTLIKMGDIFILAIPAELFARFGLMIKEKMKVRCPVIWGYANYSVAYLVDEEEYGRSFESACSDVPKGTTEKIVDEIINVIEEIKEM